MKVSSTEEQRQQRVLGVVRRGKNCSEPTELELGCEEGQKSSLKIARNKGAAAGVSRKLSRVGKILMVSNTGDQEFKFEVLNFDFCPLFFSVTS